MTAQPLNGLDRLAIHTMTHKPWSLGECVDAFVANGVNGISVWRNVIEPIGIDEAARIVRSNGMRVPALVRGGFFPAIDHADRIAAIDENKRCIDEAAALGAEMVVLVVGAVPGLPLDEARAHVADGIAACVDHAAAMDVKLAIEPLHPMYASDKSCVNTMAQALAICDELGHSRVGVAVDVYHVWWDPDLRRQIQLAGMSNRLFAFHTCDWLVETRDLLTDRGLMGEGCIDLRQIRGWVEEAGFTGSIEVEVFSETHWAKDQHAYLLEVLRAYRDHA